MFSIQVLAFILFISPTILGKNLFFIVINDTASVNWKTTWHTSLHSVLSLTNI